MTRRWSVAAAVACTAGGCGPVELSMTRGRLVLLIAFAVLVISIVLAALAGRAATKDPSVKPGEAGAGWFLLAAVAGLSVVVIGTCNSFTAPARAPAAEEPPRRRAPPVPAASPRCEDALREADLAFAALVEAHARHRTAATAADRACRVEASPSPPSAIDATPTIDAAVSIDAAR